MATDQAYRKAHKVRLSDYEPIVGSSVIEELRLLASRLAGKVVQNVNSTYTGGGVAEILSRLVPLLGELGLEAKWSVVQGTEAFFTVTKKMHNALHGRQDGLTPGDYSLFMETSDRHLEELELRGDIFYIHDPQPIGLVRRKKELGGNWVWRCHVDVSNPDMAVWDFLRGFVDQYDAAVFSAPQFSRELPVRQFLIAPSIDPLSDKNRDLPQDFIDSVLRKYRVPQDKPLVTQISRFDYLKDPVGLIEAFRLVKRSIDCRLVLAGGTATDDPESDKVLAEVQERASGDPDIHILLVPPQSDLEINALQRASTVVVQKSLKEGFGLTVAEALWKAKPVVASAVGGIPLQVKHRWTGLLSHGVEGTAYDIKRILANPELAKSLGDNGREHVRQNFLITRHLREYLLLFLSLAYKEDVVYL
ncbi:MAG: glycosyltransferase [Chloroflexi bacterium]|nr:glycosyltransferase [Chloroflexota bacterium]